MIILKSLLKIKFIIALLYLGLAAPISFGKELVLIKRPLSKTDHRSEYPRKLLQAALTKTMSLDGDFQIEYSSEMSWGRAKLMLEEGETIHIIPAATRPQWEKDLLPIRIPLMKGILGNRIFLIKRQDQEKFTSITSLNELKKLRAGLGQTWSITSAFKHNGFEVVTGTNYEGLFRMLDHERFDYFPRGINEAPVEYQQRKNKFPDIHIEETILLTLPLPVYFFVSPKNPDLAKRVERGLNLMIKDGSFDRIFFEYHLEILEKASIDKRKVFRIENPSLPPETPLNRKELWFDIQTYTKDKGK